jgi:hypothetical protein
MSARHSQAQKQDLQSLVDWFYHSLYHVQLNSPIMVAGFDQYHDIKTIFKADRLYSQLKNDYNMRVFSTLLNHTNQTEQQKIYQFLREAVVKAYQVYENPPLAAEAAAECAPYYKLLIFEYYNENIGTCEQQLDNIKQKIQDRGMATMDTAVQILMEMIPN